MRGHTILNKRVTRHKLHLVVCLPNYINLSSNVSRCQGNNYGQDYALIQMLTNQMNEKSKFHMQLFLYCLFFPVERSRSFSVTHILFLWLNTMAKYKEQWCLFRRKPYNEGKSFSAKRCQASGQLCIATHDMLLSSCYLPDLQQNSRRK